MRRIPNFNRSTKGPVENTHVVTAAHSGPLIPRESGSDAESEQGLARGRQPGERNDILPNSLWLSITSMAVSTFSRRRRFLPKMISGNITGAPAWERNKVCGPIAPAVRLHGVPRNAR